MTIQNGVMDKLTKLFFECIGIYTTRHPCRDDVNTICVISIKANVYFEFKQHF